MKVKKTAPKPTPGTTAARADRRLHSRVIVAVAIAIAALLLLKAVWVQAIDPDGAAAKAVAALKRSGNRTIPATRGTITDRNGVTLAQTLPYVTIKADPFAIATNGVARTTDPAKMPPGGWCSGEAPDYVVGTLKTDAQKVAALQVAAALADILMAQLGGSADDYLGHLTNQCTASGKPNRSELVASNVPAYTWAKIAAAMQSGTVTVGDKPTSVRWAGLAYVRTPMRVYPDGTLMSNVLGFVGVDDNGGLNGKGLEGFEQGQNDYLKGVDGQTNSEKGLYGYLPSDADTLVPAVDGYSYRLTIDAVMQQAAQQALVNTVAATGSEYGMVIMMDVKTGEVLAMANAPTFDNNAFTTANTANYRNRAIEAVYNPGSVEKVLTMAALIDQGLITPDTRVVVPGKIKSGDYWVTDAGGEHATLYLTARGVMVKSSNIGTILMARQSDKTKLMGYLASFGLGQRTGIELPTEVPSKLEMNPPDYDRDSMAFGQSLGVTAIQEAAAVAGIVNGGVYHQPTIIAGVTDGSGAPVPQAPRDTRQVVSPETSAAVLNMMQAVTESPDSAYYNSASLPGYSWAGKTGTADIEDKRTGGFKGTTASFVGVAPADDPQILVYTVLSKPAGGAHGGAVALPLAHDLMMVALPYYGVVPSAIPARYTDPITYQP